MQWKMIFIDVEKLKLHKRMGVDICFVLIDMCISHRETFWRAVQLCNICKVQFNEVLIIILQHCDDISSENIQLCCRVYVIKFLNNKAYGKCSERCALIRLFYFYLLERIKWHSSFDSWFTCYLPSMCFFIFCFLVLYLSLIIVIFRFSFADYASIVWSALECQ